MPRLLFEKTENAIWMSHLDLMRVFQRAFKRAGLSLKHTQGFNPRPSVSIALPLSVGVSSKCELLDFDLEGEKPVSNEEIKEQLNGALVKGVRVIDVYDGGLKIGNLSYLRCALDLEYDKGVPANAVENIRALFARQSLVVEKKTKSGMQQQDIIPMISDMKIRICDRSKLCLEALICCQNPTLNPGQITQAIQKYIPDFSPDFSKCCRLEIYDKNGTIFR